MIKNPKIGLRCFLIIDIWEVLVPAPVTIIAEDENGFFVARWDIGEGHFDDYDGIEPEDLFTTEAEAVEVIKAKRGLEP